jgi:hypothetical protein
VIELMNWAVTTMMYEFLAGMLIILAVCGIGVVIADKWEWIDNIFPEDDYSE